MWEAGSSNFRAENLGRCYHNNQVIKVHVSQWCHVPPDVWGRILHLWWYSKTQPNLEYVNSTPNFLRSKPKKEASQEENKETWQLNVIVAWMDESWGNTESDIVHWFLSSGTCDLYHGHVTWGHLQKWRGIWELGCLGSFPVNLNLLQKNPNPNPINSTFQI